jgi:hypothetical protein
MADQAGDGQQEIVRYGRPDLRLRQQRRQLKLVQLELADSSARGR